MTKKKVEEISRKFIHIALSNIWIIYCLFIDLLWVACILPAAFIVINSLSYKFKIFKTMEREENDGFGTVYYAISILLVTIFSYLQKQSNDRNDRNAYYGIWRWVCCYFGKKVKSKEYKILGTTKSIAGSATMFVFSLVISCVVFLYDWYRIFYFKGIINSCYCYFIRSSICKRTR